jgi:hypothetical protein
MIHRAAFLYYILFLFYSGRAELEALMEVLPYQ